jgi:uncharacterized protein (TIGR02246 family)
MRTTIAVLVLAATLPACTMRSSPALTSLPAPRTPTDVDRMFGERMNAGDLDGLLALYEPGATLVRGDRTAATGHAAIRTELAAILALKPRIVMNVKTVFHGGGDLAVLYNDYSATATNPDGSPLSITGKAIEVVRRQRDGTWRFVVDDPNARDPR